jgi:hypothetical protein
MSHSDFDVVTGPSMAQRRASPPAQNGPKTAPARTQPPAPPPDPVAPGP